MTTDKLIATWQAEDLTIKLYREPIAVGKPHEYTLIGIDSGNVRRIEKRLCGYLDADGKLADEDNWLIKDAPADAKRILARFA
jgi:hypothetical protein